LSTAITGYNATMSRADHDRTPTSEADPLATEADNSETVPNTEEDHPIRRASERAEALGDVSERET
jgi:hypothetical protein